MSMYSIRCLEPILCTLTVAEQHHWASL